MYGEEYKIYDNTGDLIVVQGRSLHGETLVNISTKNEWYELNKEKATQLITALQNAIKDVE